MWSKILPYVRSLVVLTAIWLGLIYLVEYLSGADLPSLKSITIPFLLSLSILFFDRRVKMRVSDLPSSEVRQQLQDLVLNEGYRETDGVFVKESPVIRYFRDSSVLFRMGGDWLEVEGPSRTIRKLEDKLQFADQFRSFRD